MRLKLVLLTLFFASPSFARPNIVGDWCKCYDDFVSAFQITELDGDIQITKYEVGKGGEKKRCKASGENHGIYKGYLSFGATATHMVLDHEDQGLRDYKLGFDLLRGVKTLKLFFEDYEPLKLTACKISKK